ncbi:exonuclease V, chloroplastic isoform X1 [Ziziphus jujuba]|uniref:Exonuclease V, chloroplastic isoform X1 n=1 Tax=Ziziphus jujuba TaxID=326968 RepID=A0ABM3IBL6_ZIZJJ|nr:exonuclease V, chloroplastic isoform X1 [Ziziphus jujuba]
MTESHSESVSELSINNNNENKGSLPEIPIDVVSEEEMALLEAALASARSSFPSSVVPAIHSSHIHSNVRSIHSITVLAKRRFSGLSEPDIEDSANFANTQKKNGVTDSFFLRFRKKKGLSVTDITATESEGLKVLQILGRSILLQVMAMVAKEWCEKQMEFVLLGKRKINKAMRKGSARHAKLEEEVVKKVKVHVESVEDRWALTLLNFIIGVNQLLFEGLTRELPLISFVEGVWMVGVIDEIRMSKTETDKNPLLVDTKTRVRETLPAEPQRRNGRLQLMCYKHMWDSLVTDKFPSRKFFDFFSLNPYSILSEDIRERTAYSGFPSKTLDDVVGYYIEACHILPLAHDQLLLRYEFQKDESVLGEDRFPHDPIWLKKQIQVCLEFWLGEREASYTPEEERWKCRFCRYASVCPTNANLDSRTSSPTNSDTK